MAYKESPAPEASIFTFFTKSLMESTIFLKRVPYSYLASNILFLLKKIILLFFNIYL